MRKHDTPNFQPISMLPTISELIDGGLPDITENVANLKVIQAREDGTLDDATTARFVAMFETGLEFVPIHTEQLARWQKTQLTAAQRKEVVRLQGQLVPLTAVFTEGLAIGKELMSRTIEKGLEPTFAPPAAIRWRVARCITKICNDINRTEPLKFRDRLTEAFAGHIAARRKTRVASRRYL